MADTFSRRDLFADGGAGVRCLRSVDGEGHPIDEWTFQIRLGEELTMVKLGPDQMRELHVQGLGGVASYDGR